VSTLQFGFQERNCNELQEIFISENKIAGESKELAAGASRRKEQGSVADNGKHSRVSCIGNRL